LNNFLCTVSAYIDAAGLLHKNGRYLVALSGGADSVALLRALVALGYHVEAVHCNFRLRGSESDRDEDFCRCLCMAHGVALHLAHFDTREYAALHKVSIEMAARELRYRYFEQLRADLKADGICVAHHADDSAETILLNLIRGTGIGGLMGIAPRNGYVLRPFLCVRRCDIIGYLEELKQDYVTDSSNLVADVQRNVLRLEVFPLLEKMNVSAKENILRTARWLAEAKKIVDAHVEGLQGEADIARILQQPSPEYLVWSMLEGKGFTSAQVEQITASLENPHTGREWRSATHMLYIDRGRLVVEPLAAEPPRPMRIPEVGAYVYANGCKFHCLVSKKIEVLRDRDFACLDADKVQFPLQIRGVLPGDKFVPFGMKGKKLVSDFLTDRKMPLGDKRRQLVVTDATGSIVWVVRERIDNRYRLTAESAAVLKLWFTDER